MAIYHLSHGAISRSTGRSAVQSAAYITGGRLQESRRELTADYRNRARDVEYTDTLAPEGAPAWAGDVHQIWDRLESYEDMYADKHYKTLETQEKHKKSAQTAMTIVAALPRELSPEVRKELVEEFARTRFVSRGLVVTYAIHKDEGNPHAHLIISRRSLDENGEFSWVKDRDVCRKSGVKVTRKVWADLTNHILQREGFEARITEKSFADLGINLLPTQHRGWMADKLSGKGIQSRLVFENSEIILENRNLLLERPESILTEMTANKATFTQGDLLRTIQKRIGDDEAYVAQVFEGALQSAIVVGEGMDHPDVRGEIRYTSESYLEKEQQAVALTHHLATHTYRQNITEKQIEKALGNASVSLSEEQQQAVRGLVGTQQLVALVGWAGTGKTTALKMVSELYQQTGHTVIGMSLAATAAEELGIKAEIGSNTLDLWLYRWRAYAQAQEKFLSFDAMVSEGVLKQFQWYKDLKQYERSALTTKHVLLIDEAGMIGTHKWAELQHYAVKAGAKVIAIGDDSQCNPIDAGDFFRELIHQASQAGSFYQLKDIRRQSLPWMREASVQLAQLNIQEGLSLYEKHGHLHTLDAETLLTRLATDYVTRIKQGKEGAVLASTHKQGALLNRAIRQELKQNGLIAQDDAFTLKGRSFSLGDRLMFLKNDNERLISIANHWGVTSPDHPSIKNGHQGVIREVRPFFEKMPDSYAKGKAAARPSDKTPGTTPRQPQSWFVKVEISNNRFAWFNTDQYDHITHAYTLTLQKAQGKTLDFVLVYLSKYMDAMATYVGLTRHKDDVQLYYDQAEFKTFKALGSHLSCLDYKDLVKDYTILPENQEAHQRVQAYKEAVLDTASVLAEGKQRGCRQNGQVDWALYHDLKSHQKHLGREILADFSKHKLYVQQSGLTEEMLQISTGLKARPLSRAEETAFKRVELYSETAQETRTLWNRIKETHSGFQCAQHEQYRDFQILRDQRDVLASEIMANEPLHREFFSVISERFQYGKGVLYKQAAAYEERKKQGGIFFEKSSNVPVNTSLEHHTISSHNTNHGKYDRNNTTNHTNKDTPVLIKEQLNSRIKELAFELLGKPTTQTAKEWRYGNKGSISVQVAGIKQGLYSNFEEGTSGNGLKLIQDHLGLDHKQAFKWGAEWLGNEPSSVISSLKKHPKVEQKHPLVEKWQPLFPVSAPAPDLKAEKQLAYMLRGRQEIARFAYKDAEETILGYVVRLEDRQGTKITPTLTYCQNNQGDHQWRWQGFGDDRPLYGLDQLAQKPEARVLVVEGEKTAEAAKSLFPEYAVITWSGGCGSVHKSDWSVLKGRDVILWPDNDKAGHNAVAKIKDILAEHGNEQVNLVNFSDSLSPTLPHKWDLADPLPEKWDNNTIKDLLTSAYTKTNLTLAEREEQERQQSVLTYLKEEVRVDKHSWLQDKHFAYFLNGAEHDPMRTLKRWQDVSGDDSFKPLTKKEKQQQGTEEQYLVQNPKNYPFEKGNDEQERKDSILTYLKKEVCVERNSWLNEGHIHYFLDGVEQNPMKSLMRWQEFSRDCSFKPLTKAESQLQEIQAAQILEHVQQLFSKEAFSKLSQGLPSHAEGIIHHCQSAIQSHQDKKRDLDVAKFVALKNGYQSLSRFNSPQTTERESFEKQLKELIKIYEKDDKFLTQIKSLGGKDAHILALDFLKEHTLQKELPQKNLHRGFER